MIQTAPLVRKSFRIREWMAARGLRVIDLAGELGVHHSLISATIHGRVNNRRVLRALRDKGCPHDLLALPRDLRPAA